MNKDKINLFFFFIGSLSLEGLNDGTTSNKFGKDPTCMVSFKFTGIKSHDIKIINC